MNRKARTLLTVLGIMVTILVILLAFRSRGVGDVVELPGLGDGAAVERIVLSGAFGESVIIRDGGVWRFGQPAGALADPTGVASALALFAAPTRSDIHSDIGRDPGAFGFDDPLRLTIVSGGSPVIDIEIGLVQTFADRAPDTFIRVPGAGSAFRIVGRDLRAPFSGGRFALRSRRMFPFAASDVAVLEFSNPAATESGDRLIRLAVASRPGISGSVAAPAMSRDWVVIEPAGVRPGRLNVVAARIAGLTVDAWAEKLPDGVAGNDEVPSVTVRTAGGLTVRASIHGTLDGFAWVSSEYGIARIPEADAAVLVRTVADIREPVVLPVAREEIDSVLVAGRGASYGVERRGGRFAVSGARPLELDRAAVQAWFATVAGLSAERAVRSTAAALPGEADRVLTVRLRDGSRKSVRFGVTDGSGLVPARVDGDPDTFLFQPAAVDTVMPPLEGLRRRNVFGKTPDVLSAIVVKAADGRLARLVPPGTSGDHWTLEGPDGLRESSPAVTSLAGAAMSMSASAFVADSPSSVGAGTGTIEFLGRGVRVVVRVSTAVRDGAFVCAASGDPAFSAQSFLLPSAAVQGLFAITGRGSP